MASLENLSNIQIWAHVLTSECLVALQRVQQERCADRFKFSSPLKGVVLPFILL